MPVSHSRLYLILPLASVLTSACSWVDSTGRQAGDTVSDNSLLANGIPVPTDGDMPATLSEATPVILVEQRPRETLLVGGDSRVRGWQWLAVEDETAIDSCRQMSGFDVAVAETTLANACNANECGLSYEEFYREGSTAFHLTLPALRAPLAARYRLSASDVLGNPIERDQLVCGLAVNEVPTARDDRYSVRLDETLSIEGGSSNDLLANDDDDDHVRNAPLMVDVNVTRAPRHAIAFELDADGGFRYTPDPAIVLGDTGQLADSFAYTLDDGTHTAVGQVVVLITDENNAPMLVADLPAIGLVFDADDTQFLRFDLAPYFNDEDGDALEFTAASGSLPPSGNLYLEESGVLLGIVDADDAGQWFVEVAVSDGRETRQATVDLSISVRPSINQSPVARDIANRRVTGNFGFDVTEYFDDPDRDPLRYTASGLPNGVSISEDGFISGQASSRNEGNWFVVVTAEDTGGAAISDGFRLNIRD